MYKGKGMSSSLCTGGHAPEVVSPGLLPADLLRGLAAHNAGRAGGRRTAAARPRRNFPVLGDLAFPLGPSAQAAARSLFRGQQRGHGRPGKVRPHRLTEVLEDTATLANARSYHC